MMKTAGFLLRSKADWRCSRQARNFLGNQSASLSAGAEVPPVVPDSNNCSTDVKKLVVPGSAPADSLTRWRIVSTAVTRSLVPLQSFASQGRVSEDQVSHYKDGQLSLPSWPFWYATKPIQRFFSGEVICGLDNSWHTHFPKQER